MVINKIRKIKKVEQNIKRYKKEITIDTDYYFETLFDALKVYVKWENNDDIVQQLKQYILPFIDDWFFVFFDISNFFKLYPSERKSSNHWYLCAKRLMENENLPTGNKIINEYKRCLTMIEQDYPDFIDSFCFCLLNPQTYKFSETETIFQHKKRDVPELMIQYKFDLLFDMIWDISNRRFFLLNEKDSYKSKIFNAI